MYLEKINGPADIKKLNIEQLNVLADETRHYLIEKVAKFYGDSQMKVLVRGERKHFENRYNLAELLRINHLTPEQITEDVLKTLGR